MSDSGERTGRVALARRAHRGRRAAALVVPALFALAADVLSKGWAELSLVRAEPVRVVGDLFRITLGYNTGIAFGVFADGGGWLLIATALVIAGLFVWLTFMVVRPRRPSVPPAPLGLIFGGAVANLVDRLPDGRVTVPRHRRRSTPLAGVQPR